MLSRFKILRLPVIVASSHAARTSLPSGHHSRRLEATPTRFVIVVIALAGDFNPRNEIGCFPSLVCERKVAIGHFLFGVFQYGYFAKAPFDPDR